MKKNFVFPYIEKKIPLVKVLTQKLFSKKSKIFEIFFLSKNIAKNASNEPSRSGVRPKLAVLSEDKFLEKSSFLEP